MKKYEIGDAVVHVKGIKSLGIQPGTAGVVVESLFPRKSGVAVRFNEERVLGGTLSVTAYVDESELVPAAQPKECDPDPEPEEKDEKQCRICESMLHSAGYIVVHMDDTGSAYAFRSELVAGFTDGVILLQDGTEFDCEESFEEIAEKLYEAVCL